MTIGQALKETQNRLNLNEKEMAAGVVSTSMYSRVVRGERSIRSDLLIELLLVHGIDVENFFYKVKDTYSSVNTRLEEKLENEMMLAINRFDVEAGNNCFKEISEANVSWYLKIRGKIDVAYLNRNTKDLDEDFVNLIIHNLTDSNNWIYNVNKLKLFGTAMIILPYDFVEKMIDAFFRKIDRAPQLSQSMQECLATTCGKYLHWKYDHIEKMDNLKCDRHSLRAIKFMQNLIPTKGNMIYIIAARYYMSLFTGNVERAKKIREELLDAGYNIIVNNWPV